jgi:hypothetical protein
MSAQRDFHFQLERAAGLTVDASCACRSAAILPLPHPHRRLLTSAARHLERAQDDLFQARNDPWQAPKPPKMLQLQLL